MNFDEKIVQILKNNKSIAILGANDMPRRPVEHVGRYLIEQNYRIFPVHPKRQSSWGLRCYKSLFDLPELPDIFCLFRNSSACEEHAKEIEEASAQNGIWAGRKPKVFWMQTGIFSKEAGMRMQKLGITVIEDLCIEVEHKRLLLKNNLIEKNRT